MKKILAIVLALLVALSALSMTVFAAETVVFNNPDGEAFEDCVNSWDFFGTGSVWGRIAADVLDISLEDLKAQFEADAYFVIVYSGSPAGWSDSAGAPCAVINDDFDNSTVCDYVDLGDGTYQACVKLGDVVAKSANSLDDMYGFVIQTWTDNFKLISAKFTDTAPEAPAPAEEETPAETTAAPETGLALAVVPAVMALAAVAVSKKR